MAGGKPGRKPADKYKDAEYLREHGPSSFYDADIQRSTPVSRHRDEEDYVYKFDIGSAYGDISFRSGRSKTVYYLDEHDKEDILREWLNINPNVLKNNSRRSIHMVICRSRPEFKEASEEVLRPPAPDTGGQDNTGGTCQLCGKEYKSSLPAHIRNDCPEVNND